MTNSSPPVAVLSAIPPELEALRADMAIDGLADLAGRPVYTGRLEGRRIVLAAGGIGKVNAALSAAILVERYRCPIIVFTGVAGGLDSELRVGDVVVADRTIQYDTGVANDDGLDRYQPGHVPFFNPTSQFGYPASAGLLRSVERRLAGFTLPPLNAAAGGTGRSPRVVLGTVISGDQFVNSEVARKRLRDELGGSAVEMEGAALAQAAGVLGVDWLVIRSLSDLAGAHSIVDFTTFLEEVAQNSARVVRHLLPVL